MDVKENTALTPEKKQMLIEEIQREIDEVSQAIKDKKYGVAAFSIIQSKQVELQNLLNKFLEKKGIITPSETTNTLNVINQSKKARLESSYLKSISKTTIVGIAILILGVGTYLYLKKK